MLKTTFMGRIYDKAMSQNLLRLLKKHISPLSKDLTHPCARAVASTLSIKSLTLEKFDDTFTRIAGGSPPVFPLPSAEAYYQWASSHYVLPDIRVPLLTVNSADDPVVAEVPIDSGTANPWIVMTVTGGGGHLGWFESGQRWMTKPALEWIQMSVELVRGGKSSSPYLSESGYIMELGKPGLGCQVIEADRVVDSSQLVDAGMIHGF